MKHKSFKSLISSDFDAIDVLEHRLKKQKKMLKSIKNAIKKSDKRGTDYPFSAGRLKGMSLVLERNIRSLKIQITKLSSLT